MSLTPRCGTMMTARLWLRTREPSPPPGHSACNCFLFFFQAEDGIRDLTVTGVQTCALPICLTKIFYLAQDFYWYNPSRLPTPAEWVTIRRTRVKDAVNMVWWLSKTREPQADNRRVLRPYSRSMQRLLRDGYKAARRPSQHDISRHFQLDNGGAIP